MEPRVLYGLVVLFLAGPYGCGTAQTRPANQQVQMVPVKALPVPTNCGQVPNHTLPETAQAYRLKSGNYLVSVECTPGAYQSSQVFFLLDRSGESSTAVLLSFPVLKADEQRELSLDQTGEVWGVINIDGDKSMLRVLNRFRALAARGRSPIFTKRTDSVRGGDLESQIVSDRVLGGEARSLGGAVAPTG